MLPPLPPLPSVPHVELLLLSQSPVTPTQLLQLLLLLPSTISSLVRGEQLNQVPRAQALILYERVVELIGPSRHAPPGIFIDQDSQSTHLYVLRTYGNMGTMVSSNAPPTEFGLGPVLVLPTIQLIVVSWTHPTMILVPFLHAQPSSWYTPHPTVSPRTLPPACDQMKPQPLEYYVRVAMTYLIARLHRVPGLLWVIDTLDEWPYKYSQCDHVPPIRTVLGTRVLSVSPAPVPPFCPMMQPCNEPTVAMIEHPLCIEQQDVYDAATSLPLHPTLKLPSVPLKNQVPPSPPTVQPTLDIEHQGAYSELTPNNESTDDTTSLDSGELGPYHEEPFSPSLVWDVWSPCCSLVPAKCPSLDSEAIAPSDEETVLPASPDTPPSLVLGIPSPTCSSALAKQPTLDILELGPEMEEPSPTSQDPVPVWTISLFLRRFQTILRLFYQRFQTALHLLWLLLWRNGTILSPFAVVPRIFWLFQKMILTCYQIILTFYRRILPVKWRNQVWMLKRGSRT